MTLGKGLYHIQNECVAYDFQQGCLAVWLVAEVNIGSPHNSFRVLLDLIYPCRWTGKNTDELSSPINNTAVSVCTLREALGLKIYFMSNILAETDI